MNKQIEALNIVIAYFKSRDFDNETYSVFTKCVEALAEAENQEIGDYEIKAMLDDIEWYQQEQRKLIDRIKELEKKEWQSLSDDEITKAVLEIPASFPSIFGIARAIEQALKEKNI